MNRRAGIRMPLNVVAELVVVYLLCSGPVMRFAPDVADVLYAPIPVLAEKKIAGDGIRAWLDVWNVDVSHT